MDKFSQERAENEKILCEIMPRDTWLHIEAAAELQHYAESSHNTRNTTTLKVAAKHRAAGGYS